MSIKLSKESYITLIENDIAMVETHLPDCMEQNHIEAILRDSVNHYYPKCNKKEHPALEENSLPINNSRIIKFRGKRLFNGEWAEGSYIQQDGIIVLDEGGEVEVDPDTVGQFTGLLDKNGKEIYEGDIVRYIGNHCGDYCKSEVKFDGASFSPIAFMYECGAISDMEENDQDLCIIGNIHDNPVLLKGGEE